MNEWQRECWDAEKPQGSAPWSLSSLAEKEDAMTYRKQIRRTREVVKDETEATTSK
uniref:Uncharacterized protein n=1 Tax=viral metagenome TaxID=1070528 RepID=A0A6H1ZQ38_9ZZZZ